MNAYIPTFGMLCKQTHGMGQRAKHLVMVVRMLLQTGRAEGSQQEPAGLLSRKLIATLMPSSSRQEVHMLQQASWTELAAL